MKQQKKNMLPIQSGDLESMYDYTSKWMKVKYFNYKPDTLLDEGVSEFTKWYRNFYHI